MPNRDYTLNFILAAGMIALCAFFLRGAFTDWGVMVLVAVGWFLISANRWLEPLYRWRERFAAPPRQHATHAMKQAEWGAVSAGLRVLDIILMANEFTGELFRETHVPAYTDWLGVQLTLDSRFDQQGEMHFSLFDDANELFAVRRQPVALAWGVSTVQLAERFEFGEVRPSGVWTVHIAFEGRLIAVYDVYWRTLDQLWAAGTLKREPRLVDVVSRSADVPPVPYRNTDVRQ